MKIISIGVAALSSIGLSFAVESCSGQKINRSIEIEIFIDAREVVRSGQQWAETLQKSGADRVNIRTGKIDRPEVDIVQLSSGELIAIKAAVARNRLYLPGGNFGMTEISGIKRLIQSIRDDGVETGLAEKQAFGLTAAQLVALHDLLAQPVRFSTKGIPLQKMLDQLEAQLGHSFQLDQTAIREVDQTSAFQSELRGMSSGTALAVVLRPQQLVMQPHREQGRDVELRIVPSRNADEFWPVGWPSEMTPVKTEPKLFQRLDLQIQGYPLKTTLDAIEKRMGVQMVFDWYAIEQAGIDLEKTKVSFEKDNATYISAINQLLGQARPRLKQELRLDESGRPFLWVTTLR